MCSRGNPKIEIRMSKKIRNLKTQKAMRAGKPFCRGSDLAKVLKRVKPTDAEARAYCRRIAERLAAEDPARYTTRSGPGKRPGKIFIDYLRNARGQTAIGAFSPRARPGFPIAAPLSWEELDAGVRPDTFTIDHPPKAPGSRNQKARRRPG